jgi:two-component system sensor histidine kinase AlgZ
MLQPLLENAVYHGIEPSDENGTVRIRFARKGDELHIDLSNPCSGREGALGGNHMALANIQERLALYYDLEARLETKMQPLENGSREYHVHIVLPCRKPSRSKNQ